MSATPPIVRRSRASSGLTRCTALEGAEFGVTCNAINPGWVATDSNYSACIQEIAIAGLDLTVEQYRAKVAADLPQKRFLAPMKSLDWRSSCVAQKRKGSMPKTSPWRWDPCGKGAQSMTEAASA